MDIKELGKQRQDAHPTGTERYYIDPNAEDRIGIAGEAALGRRYNLIPDLSIRPKGDNHIDYKILVNDIKVITIDVKTAIKAYNLFVKEWEMSHASDILVLAQYISDYNIEFIGWAKKEVMAVQPTRVFSSLGINNYYLHSSKLKPMKYLDWAFKNYKIIQLENK